ncbi:MAG: hypothetical protein ACM3ZU_08050 [Bacteroidota bacterium]
MDKNQIRVEVLKYLVASPSVPVSAVFGRVQEALREEAADRGKSGSSGGHTPSYSSRTCDFTPLNPEQKKIISETIWDLVLDRIAVPSVGDRCDGWPYLAVIDSERLKAKLTKLGGG